MVYVALPLNTLTPVYIIWYIICCGRLKEQIIHLYGEDVYKAYQEVWQIQKQKVRNYPYLGPDFPKEMQD